MTEVDLARNHSSRRFQAYAKPPQLGGRQSPFPPLHEGALDFSNYIEGGLLIRGHQGPPQPGGGRGNSGSMFWSRVFGLSKGMRRSTMATRTKAITMTDATSVAKLGTPSPKKEPVMSLAETARQQPPRPSSSFSSSLALINLSQGSVGSMPRYAAGQSTISFT
mmetsp:Transcript_47598/g.95908  ORF Transcript_47598/g.95908 Transcript_47598/m.95908 type:complete len:164 (+) Transcript_47598:2-493(+)